MGKLAFFCFSTIAFLIVIGVDFSQQSARAEGSFGPTDYVQSVKDRFGGTEVAAVEAPAEPEAPVVTTNRPAKKSTCGGGSFCSVSN